MAEGAIGGHSLPVGPSQFSSPAITSKCVVAGSSINIYEIFRIERHYQENEVLTDRMEENSCKSYIL